MTATLAGTSEPAGSPRSTAAVANPEPDTQPGGRRWPRAWLLLCMLAVSSMAEWQRDPAWPMLLLAAAVTLAAIALVHTVRAPRLSAIGALAALVLAVVFGAQETRTLTTINERWAEWSEQEQVSRATRMADRVRDLQTTLMDVATSAARQAPPAALPFVQFRLPVARTSGAEAATVLFRDGQLVAHAGQTRVPMAAGTRPMTLVSTPFYTALVARAWSPDRRYQAQAVVLLSAEPPADRFTKSLVQDVAGSERSHVRILPPLSPDGIRLPAERLVSWGAEPFARVVPPLLSQGETGEAARQHARTRTIAPLAVAALLMLITSWRRPARTRERLLMVFALLIVVARVPLGALSNLSAVFDPSYYFVRIGWTLTANVAALIVAAALCLCGLFLVLRSPKLFYSRRVGVLIVLGMAGAGPFLVRDLARGITFPPSGASVKLWVAWQLAIALAGASILLAGASAGQVAIGARRGLPSWLAPAIACTAALLALPLLGARGVWPAWYPALWVLAIASLAFVRRSLALILGAAIVAGSGAVTLTWGATVRTRMRLAEIEVSRLAVVDESLAQLLQQFARALSTDSAPLGERDALLRRYANSDLGRANLPARIARWMPASPDVPVLNVAIGSVSDSLNAQPRIAAIARQSGGNELYAVPSGGVTILIAAVPSRDGTVTTIAVGPRNSLQNQDPLAVMTGVADRSGGEPPYRLSLVPFANVTERPSAAGDVVTDRMLWSRSGETMHGDAITRSGARWPVHVKIDLRGPDALVPRGALLVLLDVMVVLLLWGACAMSDGALWRWFRQRGRRLASSYRVRLSVALLAFFMVPAATFAGWAAFRLREGDRAARELVVREALRVAALEPSREALAQVSADVGAPLFLYRNGQLTAASDSLIDLLAPIGRLLPDNLGDITSSGPDTDDFEALTIPTGSLSALVGYRRVRIALDSSADSARANTGDSRDSTPPFSTSAIVATPASGNEFALDERRADLAVQVLLAVSLGAFAAIWLSGVAARSLARPVGSLREAALALAAGERGFRLEASPVTEFAPVFRAFTRMADDLSTSRDALEAAQRRTEAVLQHVASGVLALRTDGTIIIANPRAETMLGVLLRAGTSVAAHMHSLKLQPLFARVAAFLRATSEDDAFDATVNARQLNARLTRLPGGAVLTLDDVTELASAQRVLAWGEMARQVAHEIKNPLTPIRLGVQHLRRAYRDGRGDFSDILERNVGRVLEEIDHLDEIARAFSRYGTARAEHEAPVVVSLGDVMRAVLALESMGESGVTWTLNATVDDGADRGWARSDELKEVLLNVLENARLAGARHVELQLDRSDTNICIVVVDDGAGIPAEIMPRIFEPHFSTRTSGSGLGLAISRRLMEGWGGSVEVASEVGRGTTVRIVLRAAP